MTVKDIVITLCKERGLSQEQLAAKMCKRGRTSIAVPLLRRDGMGMKVETLVEWLDALDCQLVVVGTEDEDEYVLDGDSMGIEYKEDMRCN